MHKWHSVDCTRCSSCDKRNRSINNDKEIERARVREGWKGEKKGLKKDSIKECMHLCVLSNSFSLGEFHVFLIQQSYCYQLNSFKSKLLQIFGKICNFSVQNCLKMSKEKLQINLCRFFDGTNARISKILTPIGYSQYPYLFNLFKRKEFIGNHSYF